MIYQSVAIVTGASRGLGAATARWLSKAKAAPVLVARHKDRLVTQQDRIRRAGGMCLTIPADVTVPDACRRVAQTVLEQFGRIDILINNAAVLEPIAPISRANVGLWRRSLETNVLGPLLLTRAALPSIRKMKGRIINISSGVVDRIFLGWSAYCTTKAALNQLTRSMALEEPEVTTLAVDPGTVDTGMQALIRRKGVGNMAEAEFAAFMDLKNRGGLQPPEIPSRTIACLALKAPSTLSGRVVQTKDQAYANPALSLLGPRLKPHLDL